MARKHKGWEEELQTPFIINSFDPKDSFKEQFDRKIKALFEHYKISSTSENVWFELAMKLAMDFVPCFKIDDIFEKGFFNSDEAIIFYAQIRKLARSKNISSNKAIEQYYLAQEYSYDYETLKTNFYKIKKLNHMIVGQTKTAKNLIASFNLSEDEQKEMIEEMVDKNIIELADALEKMKNKKTLEGKTKIIENMNKVLFSIIGEE